MPKSHDQSDDERRKRRRRRRREGEEEEDNDSDGTNDDDLRNRNKGRRSRKDYDDRRRDEESDSSSSSSSSSEESDGDDDGRGRRRRKRRKESRESKEKKKKKRRKDDKKKKSRKKKKSSKHDKKKRSKKRARRDDDDDDDYDKKKRSRGNGSGTDTGEDDEEDGNAASKMEELARNYELAESLNQLLLEHPTPTMAKDTLPLVLLKLGGGTSLDLSQMPDRSASVGIQRVLKALQPFGVGEEGPQLWKWTVPGGRGGDERFLLRIVRTLLNDIGFTMEAIAQKNQKARVDTAEVMLKRDAEKKEKADTELDNNNNNDMIKDYTLKLLLSFQPKSKDEAVSTLPGELGGLCKMLLEGENVALDGLPDAKLRQSLEGLFHQCGLEMQEMDPDSDDDDDDADADDEEQNDNERAMGYGLPESPELEKIVQAKLLSVMRACETAASTTQKPTTTAVAKKGPMPMPANYKAPEESSDEEGPAPVGAAKRKEPPPMSKELIKHQAEMRARQLRGAATGQEELLSTDPNSREEWMLDPGKFDFLSSIKAGNPMKSRNFRAKSKAGATAAAEPSRVMDPKIKAEMDAIMQAHTNARGPTLVEQHRLKKKQEREAKAAAGGKRGQWQWSRDKDLESGRRVDKDALHQVLGGATEDLKKKFQGGF